MPRVYQEDRAMRMCARIAVAAAFVAAAVAAPAGAALTDAQFDCQKTVAKQGRKLLKKTFNYLAKCHNKVNKGTLPADTDCTAETDTAAKITGAEAAFELAVKDACSSAVIGTLSFGATCFGVSDQDGLVACSIDEHNAAARALIDALYADPGRRCTGGDNDGDPCDDDTDCPPDGTCDPLSVEQGKCLKLLGKTVIKHANKRLAVLQKCKKDIGKDKDPATTDCVATGSTKLSELLTASIEKIDFACPTTVISTLQFGDVCEGHTDRAAIEACALCLEDKRADDLILVQYGSSPRGATAVAKQITDTADCVGGPLSRCRVNDYLLANGRIRVVVQDVGTGPTSGRNLFGVGQFGGQIIDADLVRGVGDPDRDNFEEWSISLNIEGTAHYTDLYIVNDGSNGGPAVLRATGVDDLLDFLNPSSVVARFGLLLPASADDVDLPVTVQTDYILEPGKNYVRVETTIQHTGGTQKQIFFGDFINGSGQIELFQPGYGFGEPTVATTCPITPSNVCNFVAWSGEDEADGVSYGYVHDVPGSSTFTTSGVNVPQLSTEVLLALIGLATPPFTLEPVGNPGDSVGFTRYFVVGDGSVSAISDARNEIKCLPTGRLEGTVTIDGAPAARADIAVFGNTADGPGTGGITPPLTDNVVTHARTDDLGAYSLTLPVGDYTVAANLDGAPYEGGGSTPVEHAVTIAAFQSVQQDIDLPPTGALQVIAENENNDEIAAKASVVGFDPSPDPLNNQSVLGGLLKNTTGVFGDRSKDGLPYGVARALFIGPSGDSGVVPIEPSDYRVVVSHGPEYSISETDITVAADPAPPVEVNAQVHRVVDTTGFVASDFHVHAINSPDSEVTNAERVLTMVAEGAEFFTPSDHDIRVDFQSTIADLDAEDFVSVATSSEITTFDYGHFNAWPMEIDPNQVNGGSVDHGGAAPDGLDFPSAGYYNETPATIIALAKADPGSDTVQINHIHSHFGLDGDSGLAIDTGVDPPQSAVPRAARRLPDLPEDPDNFFTDTFDALEVWIGDNRQQIRDNFLGTVTTGNGGNIGDWFNLINQGIVRTGVADSDTHKRVVTQAAIPRSMVASPTDDPGELDEIAETLSSNVNAGRVVGTNAPMVRVTAYAASTGESGGLDLGRCSDGVTACTNTSDCPPCTTDDDCALGFSCVSLPTLISTGDGAVDITVDIQSPTWAEFDRVEFYVNTTTTKRTLLNKQTGAGLINVKRYQVTPDYVKTKGVDFTVSTVPVNGANRLEASTTLSLSSLTEDIWVAVLVKGTDAVSKPLFPVVPNDLKKTTNTTLANLTDGNLGEDGITALAFTNPVFIDVDGGGWTAPGVQVNP